MPPKGNLFSVTVEKQMYCSGTIEVIAETYEEAQALVETGIKLGTIQTSLIKDWDDPEYVDESFKTTGDVAKFD